VAEGWPCRVAVSARALGFLQPDAGVHQRGTAAKRTNPHAVGADFRADVAPQGTQR